MIHCSHCGHTGEYTGPHCPVCSLPYSLSEDEKQTYRDILRAEGKGTGAQTYVEACRILCDAGEPAGVCAYADLLVSDGQTDAAAALLASRAEDNGAMAFRYGKLRYAMSEEEGLFWLSYAATAYRHAGATATLGDIYAAKGDFKSALRFYRLAAAKEDVGAIRSLAHLYAGGAWIEANLPVAKWYLSHLPHPLFSEPWLTARLSRVRPVEPAGAEDELGEYFLETLIPEAEAFGLKKAAFHLNETLAERGNVPGIIALAKRYIEGNGCAGNVEHGLALLKREANVGHTAAALALGDIYLQGRGVEVDTDQALAAYLQASDGGDARGYERIGDYYKDGMEGNPRIAYAMEWYEKAIRLGSADAAKKAQNIRAEREAYYNQGMSERKTAPEEALRDFVTASHMGYLPADVRIGDCYLFGIGVEKDKKRAYLWYSRAVEKKAEEGYYPLALCYLNGIGTEISLPKAMHYFRLAKAAGVTAAENEILALCERKKKKMMRSLYAFSMEMLYQKKFEEAFRALRILIDKTEDGQIMYTYAICLEFGLGTKEDGNLAHAYYQCAAEAGFVDYLAKFKSTVLRFIHRV